MAARRHRGAARRGRGVLTPPVAASVREVLAGATRDLAAAGVGSPRVDAELLLADLLDVPRSRLVVLDRIPAAKVAEFAVRVARRAAREPLQHIVGRAYFRYIELAVGPGVFVPRPETELLVEAVLPSLRSVPAPVAVDLCSGSGALALALADEVPGARVLAVENSPDALVWLGHNAAGAAVEVVAADVRNPELLPELRGRVDAVVCNPPYVPSGTPVEPEVRADPAVAVFAGPSGLDLMASVINTAAGLLTAGGVLALEHDDSHGAAVPALVQADRRWSGVRDEPDLTGRPRYVRAVRA